MIIKKFAAVLLGIACMAGGVSCQQKGNSDNQSVSIGDNGVGELITPDENSADYELGSYRIDKNGVKLYYDDTEFTAEMMLALEEYFMCFQNGDYGTYLNITHPDYVERYDKYLREIYSETQEDVDEYTLENSFDLQCENIRQLVLDQEYYNTDSEEQDEFTGDFKITRIKAEAPTLDEDETEDDRVKSFFSYLDTIFDIDYYDTIKNQADSFKCMTFFIIAEGDDGEEHLIISETDIVLAEKDGKYYTFG